jgi:hypothetical protein
MKETYTYSLFQFFLFIDGAMCTMLKLSSIVDAWLKLDLHVVRKKIDAAKRLVTRVQ